MNRPKRYRCVKTFALDRIDEDGGLICGDPVAIEAGTLFEKSDRPLFAAVAPAVRLETDGFWIEIHPDTLALYFEEVQ